MRFWFDTEFHRGQMTQVELLSDKELLDGLERLAAEKGVVLRTCRSGVKINIGFEGHPGGMQTFFGGPDVGIDRGDGTEACADNYTGGNVRYLLSKAIRAMGGK